MPYDPGPQKTDENVLLVTQQPQAIGLHMCDRDVRLKTSIVGSASFEDLKVNTTSLQRENWDEISLVDVYKDDGAGGYVAVVDQVDADTNARLSVWDYQGNDQASPSSPIAYDIRGGSLRVDANVPAAEDHQAYVVAAPDIPSASGGQIRLFDGYMQHHAGGDLGVLHPAALTLDPAQAAAASVIRVYLYYPAGAKRTHILRLRLYRPAGTF